MNKFLYSTALAGGLAILGFAGTAQATTVLISGQNFYDSVTNPNAPVFGTVAPNSYTQLFSSPVSGDQYVGSTLTARSPYELNTDSQNGTAYSVLSPGGQPSPGSSATYNLGGSTTFEILWGSPDSYNIVTFYSGANGGGIPLGTYNGTGLTCYPTTCTQLAWDDVTFTAIGGGGIGSVVLQDTGQAAFEYGLNPASIIPQTPLPAAVWMFGTVIAGAAGAARLRRRKA